MEWALLIVSLLALVEAVWLGRTLRELDGWKRAQSDAEEALSSMSRAERRRAHRQLWRNLPTPEE